MAAAAAAEAAGQAGADAGAEAEKEWRDKHVRYFKMCTDLLSHHYMSLVSSRATRRGTA